MKNTDKHRFLIREHPCFSSANISGRNGMGHGATHSSTPQLLNSSTSQLLNTDFLSENISAFISEHQWKK
jgi:hypothetical protein